MKSCYTYAGVVDQTDQTDQKTLIFKKHNCKIREALFYFYQAETLYLKKMPHETQKHNSRDTIVKTCFEHLYLFRSPGWVKNFHDMVILNVPSISG